MNLDAWYKSTDFAIMITISVNTGGFGAFLTNCAYNKYTYLYYIIACIRNTYICLKCTKFLKINAGNSLSDCYFTFVLPILEYCSLVLGSAAECHLQLLERQVYSVARFVPIRVSCVIDVV